jgi:hypothetical protein
MRLHLLVALAYGMFMHMGMVLSAGGKKSALKTVQDVSSWTSDVISDLFVYRLSKVQGQFDTFGGGEADNAFAALISLAKVLDALSQRVTKHLQGSANLSLGAKLHDVIAAAAQSDTFDLGAISMVQYMTEVVKQVEDAMDKSDPEDPEDPDQPEDDATKAPDDPKKSEDEPEKDLTIEPLNIPHAIVKVCPPRIVCYTPHHTGTSFEPVHPRWSRPV